MSGDVRSAGIPGPGGFERSLWESVRVQGDGSVFHGLQAIVVAEVDGEGVLPRCLIIVDVNQGLSTIGELF
ncbi:hypothetical protein CXF35_00005 [Corynebacterium bovis]|uniref:Uncharacterized protein n=1 Tax=Corynebacterium bovis TaxID=36808 RepID=A0A3R8PFC9_9CORY|nr:hypothetical protein CXF36_00155 [Corynebacterium bovis]RRO85266.1 hypothetical protein CXF37_00155 [Corynebacterium bovis]RRO92747.1 hypothetical protein CXF40_02730 [Corynebacterium bovis]RRQ00510.1 hypothetical protein CXF41_06920 [Corynebacterium bovis]RRQ04018.1 hypothetical protein CXF42_05600 [Corynebacterium bovis]